MWTRSWRASPATPTSANTFCKGAQRSEAAGPVGRLLAEMGNASAIALWRPSTAMIDGYDVRLKPGAPVSNRTSYLIAPGGRILAVHSKMDWKSHVSAMLAAAKAWRQRQG